MSSLDAFERVVTSLREEALGHADWPESACLISEVSRTRGSALALIRGQSQIDGELFYTQFVFAVKSVRT